MVQAVSSGTFDLNWALDGRNSLNVSDVRSRRARMRSGWGAGEIPADGSVDEGDG